MTQIYYTSISKDLHDLLMSKFLPEFSNNFAKKLLSYRRWEDAQLSLLGRLLLKHGFEKNNKTFNERELIFSAYNKPMLKDESFQFNISHSGDIAICVISDLAEVGVDIEFIKHVDVSDFKSQMTSKEWYRLNAADSKNQAFYEYWTQKEAVLKANGKGLSIPLDSFEVETCNSKIDEDLFYLKEIQVDSDYKCHIAFKNNLDQNYIRPEEVVFNIN